MDIDRKCRIWLAVCNTCDGTNTNGWESRSYPRAMLLALVNSQGFCFLVKSEIMEGQRGLGRSELRIRVIMDVV